MHRTLDDIRREGLAALRTRLGRAGMIRFLHQFETGQGDYAGERRNWVDRTTLDDLKPGRAGSARRNPTVRTFRRRVSASMLPTVNGG